MRRRSALPPKPNRHDRRDRQNDRERIATLIEPKYLSSDVFYYSSLSSIGIGLTEQVSAECREKAVGALATANDAALRI
jgi:hypothetical protein